MKAPTSTLRAARERSGLTIRQLHAATHIATGRLSMLERRLVAPHPFEMDRLSAALGAAPIELFPPDGESAA
jgi:transcriptional regulator with XRE-family HTH domain